MPNQPLARSALLMLVIVLVSVTSWELYLRSNGFENDYYDDPALWAHTRAKADGPADKTTVFIGSSRIKFDTDIPTWEKITGEQAVQLACVGSTPVPVLHHLANDEKFKGKLIVDVVEGLFFSLHGSDRRPVENMKYYKEETPAQWASFYINHLLESKLVFLDKEWHSLGAQLKQLPLKDRPGIRNFKGFPSDFGRVKFSRQEYMTNKMASDTSISNIVTHIWQIFAGGDDEKPLAGKQLDSFLTTVKISVDKIRARGGQVIFVRPPSSGTYLERELKKYPRQGYWDKLLKATNTDGIHYTDDPVMAALKCPEESHLSLSDAAVFTKELIQILEQKNWFPKKN
ncbi:MAG: hypothetical protein HYX40_09770 [Sphingobacteriales bacterium]|nr:hypothetical protein [Sphingobacteriales bacterium]